MTDEPAASAATAAAQHRRPVPDRLPPAAWALAAACLVTQLLQLAKVGPRELDLGWVPSMLLGALLVTWVSAGVLRARTGRLVVVWLLFGLAALGDTLGLLTGGLSGGLGWPLVDVACSAASVAALAWFCRTDYFAWQRTRPHEKGPDLVPVLLVAVLVGLLGGTTDAAIDPPAQVRLD